MDLLIVNCPSHKRIYQSLHDNNLSALEPPIWAGLIANFMRCRGYEVSILDAQAEGLSIEETAQSIIDCNPVLALFAVYGHQPSASTQCMTSAIEVCHLIKDGSGVNVMFMGTHSASLPKETIIESKADFICTGEGPYTVDALLPILKSGSDDYSICPDMCYLKDSTPVVTDKADLISDLDKDIPGLAWDLLPMSAYRAHNWHCLDGLERQPYASLYTSLGCPFKCDFCCINAPFGGATIRYLSPDAVIKEIDTLVNVYGVRNIKIPDEMFVLHRHHVIGICDKIIERGYDLNIWAYARIDTVQDEFLDKLRRAGFLWLALGIESGSDSVREHSRKKLNDNNIIDTVEKIRTNGINVIANYIFGLPHETIETMQQTLDLAIDLNTEWSNFYCAMAYPGSPLHVRARDNGLPLPESTNGPGWIGYSQHAYETLPLATEHLSAGDIIKFRDMAHQKYFEGEKFLSLIESKFGKDSRDHVEDMNKIKLKRLYVNE